MGILTWLLIIFLAVAGGIAVSYQMFQFIGFAMWSVALVLLIFKLLRKLTVLRRIFSVLLCVLLLAAVVTEGFVIYAALGQESGDADHLIVLGAGVNGTTPSLSLSNRLVAARDYLDAHPDTLCVVSGGQGKGEDISEAECMYRYLTQNGIDGSRIIREDRSTSTIENLQFSKALLEKHLGEAPKEVAILSSEYHLFRAGLMAREVGFEPVLIPAQTSWKSLQINYFLREIPAVWHYLINGGYQYVF